MFRLVEAGIGGRRPMCPAIRVVASTLSSGKAGERLHEEGFVEANRRSAQERHPGAVKGSRPFGAFDDLFGRRTVGRRADAPVSLGSRHGKPGRLAGG